jgi:hypothetical protein
MWFRFGADGRLEKRLLGEGITITFLIIFLPNQSSRYGGNPAGILVSIARTLTEAAKKNNARKVKKKWTAGEPRPLA